MDRHRAQRALEETARRNGISTEQVIAEIEEAIAEAVSQAQREGNRSILACWDQIPCEGDVPNAYELVAYIGHKCMAQYTDETDII